MTESLGDLLRRGVDSIDVPHVDLAALVAEAGRRRRRRRYVAVATAAAAVSAIVLGSVLAASTGGSRTEGPSPAVTPAITPTPSPSVRVETRKPRPLVYGEGRTVHVGDRAVRATKPVAFIAPTDDGAVYEATLDRSLWFTDGITTEVIGTSPWAAAPTAHRGSVSTGPSGSLVVWGDMKGHEDTGPVEFVVFDTSRRAEVARIPFPKRGQSAMVEHVGDDEVWYRVDDGIGRTVYRFDVRSGSITRSARSALNAMLERRPRIFTTVAGDGRVLQERLLFDVVGDRLRARVQDDFVLDDAAPVTLPDGSTLRLRLPTGYVGPWPADEEPALAVAQWLDDDHIVLWADDGGGDLPAKSGDLLVCPLPRGVCQVTVPRSSREYVAPYLS